MTRKMVTLLLACLTVLAGAFTGLLLVMGTCVIRRPVWLRQLRFTVLGEYMAQTGHGLRHPQLLRSGATHTEACRPLPGDDLVSQPLAQATRAETIVAQPAAIWPWLIQMGYGRAGYYAWYLPEGDPEYSKTISADRILPEFQDLHVGDVWLDGPECDPEQGAWRVKSIDPRRSLVLFAARDVGTGLRPHPLPDFDPTAAPPRGMYFVSSWAFVLEPIDAVTTRLLVRTRALFGPRWLRWLWRIIVQPGDTVMQRTMLQGIKERAELLWRTTPHLAEESGVQLALVW